MVRIGKNPIICLMICLASACLSTGSDRDIENREPADEASLMYLQEEVPPCAPVPKSKRDPCAVRGTPNLPSIAFFPLYLEMPAYWDLYYERDEPPSIFTPHLVIRATFLPNTTRCAAYKHELPAFTNHALASIEYLMMCFIDVRINDYLIGKGPPNISIAAHVYPFLYVEEDSLNWIEGHRSKAASAYEGREGVLFLAPSSTTVVETWGMIEFWDVQRAGDDVRVVAPYKETIERMAQREFTAEELKSEFTPERLALLEVPLSDFETTISEGAAARAAETGGRIAVGDNLPMLITDANMLRPYYEGPGVGVVYETDAPALPPPVPGGNEPVGPPAKTGEDPGEDQTPPTPGDDTSPPLSTPEDTTTTTTTTTTPSGG